MTSHAVDKQVVAVCGVQGVGAGGVVCASRSATYAFATPPLRHSASPLYDATNLGDRIRGTLGDIDPLNKVPV